MSRANRRRLQAIARKGLEGLRPVRDKLVTLPLGDFTESEAADLRTVRGILDHVIATLEAAHTETELAVAIELARQATAP